MDPVNHTPAYDLLVRGGRLVDGRQVTHADLAVLDGRIAAVLDPGTRAEARETVDARGLYVLPGLIDSHVHFRTPGLTGKEEWANGSRAAVAGAVTTVIDMPNTRPATFTPADAHAKHALIEGNSLVDYRFHAGVNPDDVSLLEDFTPREATSAKAFLTGHHTAPHVLRDPARLDGLFRLAAAKNLRLLFHAEDDDVFALLDQWQGEPPSYRSYEAHRPRSGGIVAVAKLIELARRHGTDVHVLHVSSKEEADLLAAAGAAGIPITFEVTGHHLSFTTDDTLRLGPRIRLSPAIREQADQDRLWQAVIRGEVACVGSDHAPHALTDKALPAPDAPPGLPGVQELFPALLTGLRRRLPGGDAEQALKIAVRVMAEGPARLFGLEGRKGALTEGHDADLALVSADTNWWLRADEAQAKVGWSAYEGWTFTGRVEQTLRRGRSVYARRADGTAVFGRPDGRWLEAHTPVLAGVDR
ncbi:dihydroorotase [Streptomyces monashensis]|uniref:Dihydroorotase n=1 Tax=Streptomyces monashensis TaxID=1678012 RepID=A0A1S2PEN2_9ACTN|nr:dihydroorotase family protein [Streptomyces monashensis]OIJ92309.1 dihydroorotase [Streptomyces monashensis]